MDEDSSPFGCGFEFCGLICLIGFAFFLFPFFARLIFYLALIFGSVFLANFLLPAASSRFFAVAF